MPVATSTELNPGSEPIVGARVTVRLITSPDNPWAPGYVPSDNFTIAGQWETTTDDDGVWSTPDVPSTDDVVPANSVYIADIIPPNRHTYRHVFLLPDSPGPHRVEDNLADPPADMPSLLSDVIAELATVVAGKLDTSSTAQTKAGDLTLQGQVIVRADAVIDVRGRPGWDPIAAENDVAFGHALDAAEGGGKVALPPLLNIGEAHYIGEGVDLNGRGSRQSAGTSEVRCTSEGAGLRFGDIEGPHAGGISSGFRVNGNGLALEPFYVGMAVGRTFIGIDIDGSAGIGLMLQGAGNCLFVQVNVLGSALDNVQVDRAAGNSFMKCESGGAGRYQLNLCSNGGVLPFLTDYPQDNIWSAKCIFEYHTDSTVAQIHQGAGINNMISDAIIATSGAPEPASPDLRLVHIEKAGSPFSTDLKLRDCTLQFNFEDPDTVAAEIGDGTRLILSGTTSVVQAGTGFLNDNTGRLEADRVVTTEVTTLKRSLNGGAAGLAYMRLRPDINEPIACTSVTGINRALPVYSAEGAFVGYVAVGQGLA